MLDVPKNVMRKRIGIIGFGNMGSAIAQRIKTKYNIAVFDIDKAKTENVTGEKIAESVIDLVRDVEIVILAVKPRDFDSVLNEIKDYAKNKLIISIAAGVNTNYIEKYLDEARVTRVMPNLPAKIGKGMICLCLGSSANKEDLTITEQLFRNLGEVLILNEDMMDEATAISGSGPGYLYDWGKGKNKEEIRKYAQDIFIPFLAIAAQGLGFTEKQANILAKVTASGSIAFLEESGLSPSELKRQVASKGGTTEAGLEVLHKGGSLEEAAKAALSRAKELAREEQ